MSIVNVYAKAGSQVVIERGNLGKVVLELAEAKQVLDRLPEAIATALKGISDVARLRRGLGLFDDDHGEAVVRGRTALATVQQQRADLLGSTCQQCDDRPTCCRAVRMSLDAQ